MLGLTFFCSQFPSFLFGPLGGVVADRMDRRRVFIVTQVLSMAQSFALGILTLSGHASIEMILLLAVLQGIINAFDLPARTSFLSDLVPDRYDFANAIALNSAMFNLARLVGPAIAGLVIPFTGEGWCFLIDGSSYLPVLIILSGLTSSRAVSAEAARAPIMTEIKDGVRYTFAHPVIRIILGVVAMLSFFGMQYGTMMPAIAKEMFGGGPTLLGVLMSIGGAGSFIGAALLAARRNVSDLPKLILPGMIVVGIGLLGLALSPSAYIAAPWVFCIGAGMIYTLASCNTIVQSVVDDNKRGRVMSLYGMAFLGVVPLGALALGSLAEHWGPEAALFVGGFGCLLGAATFGRWGSKVTVARRESSA
jgi:MFS family permease